MENDRQITAPSVEPITLADAKLFMRVDDTYQDDVITLLIVAAREYAERYTGRAFVTQTRELTLPCFKPVISIPNPPLQSIESVKYIDTAGVLQTVSASEYQVDAYDEPGRVASAYGYYWPATRLGDFNAVRIRYVCGYAEIGSPTGDDPADGVPELVKQWLRVRVAQHYEHREAVVAGTIVAPLPADFVDGMLNPLRVGVLA